MTKPTPKRKPFRRKMWATIYEAEVTPDISWTRRDAADRLKGAFVIPGRVARVLITELPRKGRDGK